MFIKIYIVQLAKGEVGLIITGCAYVSPEKRLVHRQRVPIV